MFECKESFLRLLCICLSNDFLHSFFPRKDFLLAFIATVCIYHLAVREHLGNIGIHFFRGYFFNKALLYPLHFGRQDAWIAPQEMLLADIDKVLVSNIFV